MKANRAKALSIAKKVLKDRNIICLQVKLYDNADFIDIHQKGKSYELRYNDVSVDTDIPADEQLIAEAIEFVLDDPKTIKARYAAKRDAK